MEENYEVNVDENYKNALDTFKKFLVLEEEEEEENNEENE